MLAILGRSIASKKFSAGTSSIWILISGRRIDDFGRLISGTVTSWGEWHLGQRWHRLSAYVGWRCACSFASPLCLRDLWCAIVARNASGRLVSTKHSRVSFYPSLRLFMPRKLNTPLHLLSRLGMRFLIRNCISSIAAREKPSLAIFATFRAWRMLDCSNCTRPPCLAMVADILNTYKKLVAACNDEIRRLPQPYNLPEPPLTWFKTVSSTHEDSYDGIHARKSPTWPHHDVRFPWLCGQMPW